MSHRTICASIHVLLYYVSLLLLCAALCSAETTTDQTNNEIANAPIYSSVRRLLAANDAPTLMMFIRRAPESGGGGGGVTAVTVPVDATVRDLMTAAHVLPSQRLLTHQGVELLPDDGDGDNTLLAELGIAAEATFIVEDIEYIDLMFYVSESFSTLGAGTVSLHLPLNRPIYDEIRRELSTKYGVVVVGDDDDQEYNLVLALQQCMRGGEEEEGTTFYYSDLRLVRLHDFLLLRNSGGDHGRRWEMVNFIVDDDKNAAFLHQRKREHATTGVILSIPYTDFILPSGLAFVYKNRDNDVTFFERSMAELYMIRAQTDGGATTFNTPMTDLWMNNIIAADNSDLFPLQRLALVGLGSDGAPIYLRGGPEDDDDDDVGTAAAAAAATTGYLDLSFYVRNAQFLESRSVGFGAVTLRLSLNQPIFDEIRQELKTKYDVVVDYNLALDLAECMGATARDSSFYYYSDLQLVRLKDFRSEEEWQMINFVRAEDNTAILYDHHRNVVGGGGGGGGDGQRSSTKLLILRIPDGQILHEYALVYKNRIPIGMQAQAQAQAHADEEEEEEIIFFNLVRWRMAPNLPLQRLTLRGGDDDHKEKRVLFKFSSDEGSQHLRTRDIYDSGTVVLRLPLNRPIFNEIRNRLFTKYNVDVDCDLTFALQNIQTTDDYDAFYYGDDLRLISVDDDFHNVDDGEWKMINFVSGDDTILLYGTSSPSPSARQQPSTVSILLEIPDGIISDEFALIYKERSPVRDYTANQITFFNLQIFVGYGFDL